MSMVNISLMTFNHFNICKFLSEIETEYPDLYYCTAVQWFGRNEAGVGCQGPQEADEARVGQVLRARRGGGPLTDLLPGTGG